MRLFLAINLEPSTRQAIIDATASLREAAPGLGWLDTARVHLTLKFLGEQPADAVDRLTDALDRVAARHRAFPVGLGGIGAFPNFRRARVVWMGVEREPRLELLHHDVEVACEALGYDVEGRAFRPHLTLARVPARGDVDELRRVHRAGKAVGFAGATLVGSVDIMHSVLHPAPARYDCLHRSALRS